MLRVGNLGFVGTDAEKTSIKMVNVGQRCGHRHVVSRSNRFQRNARRSQFRFTQPTNRFMSLQQVIPKLLDIFRVRKTSGHTDDRNRFVQIQRTVRITPRI